MDSDVGGGYIYLRFEFMTKTPPTKSPPMSVRVIHCALTFVEAVILWTEDTVTC